MHNKLRLIVMLASILLIVAALVLMFVFEKNNIGDGNEYGVLEYNGEKYKKANNRVNILLMGIDEEGTVESSGSFMNRGIADFLTLLSVDIKTHDCYIIHINRDTITPVEMYGVGAAYLGKADMQISLAHQYGDGTDFSCINTAKAVSDLLYKTTIDYYLSLNLDSITIVNDFVGGVEVKIEDDFSAVDPSLVQGTTMTLKGSQAETFVRSRGGMPDATNLARMSRQRVYIDALVEKLFKLTPDELKTLALKLTEYTVTNCPVNVYESYFEKLGDIKMHDISYIEGTTSVVDGYMEFYPNKDNLLKVVIDNLYVKK